MFTAYTIQAVVGRRAWYYTIHVFTPTLF